MSLEEPVASPNAPEESAPPASSAPEPAAPPASAPQENAAAQPQPRGITREEFMALSDEEVAQIRERNGGLPDGSATMYDYIDERIPRQWWPKKPWKKPEPDPAAEAAAKEEEAKQVVLINHPGPHVDVAALITTMRPPKLDHSAPVWANYTMLGSEYPLSLEVRRQEVLKLVAWTELHFRRVLLEMRAGQRDPHRGPWWEPSLEFAGLMEMTEPRLNSFWREATGMNAREAWDQLRVREDGVLEKLKAEIAAFLKGRRFVKKEKGKEVPRKPGFGEILRELRAARREAGWTRQQRAWDLGFRNHARLNVAVYQVHKKTLVQIEAETVMELARTWTYDPNTCTFFQENQPANTPAPSTPQPQQSPAPVSSIGETRPPPPAAAPPRTPKIHNFFGNP
ncbi:MAG: hypothetical protein HY291_24250 [Planctomycetes bacterium]|nr:hypothetical protein [Planctomycetota bacterium]